MPVVIVGLIVVTLAINILLRRCERWRGLHPLQVEHRLKILVSTFVRFTLQLAVELWRVLVMILLPIWLSLLRVDDDVGGILACVRTAV